ncbi:MAG: glycosyltransferase [Bacteroidales bacterium]|nr:glycosyltransferase [Bacteroidales bacterium]
MVGNTLKLIFITNFDFTKRSGAAWDRIMSYSKIFPTDNFQLVFVSSFYDLSNDTKVQKWNNVEFIYSNYKSRSSKLKDLNFLSNWRFCKQVYRLFNKEQHIRYFLYNINLSIVFSSLIYLKIVKKQKVFIEKNELETAIALNFPIDKKSITRRVSSVFVKFLRILFGLKTDFLAVFFNGIIAISKNIERIYNPFNSNVNYIPILIDPENAITSDELVDEQKEFKIGYFGWISENKDGVFSLIEAVKQLSVKHPVSLHLYGDANSDTLKYINTLSVPAIVYHGNLSQDQVLPEAIKYDLLTLIRPDNLQTKFGFSTKLATYLLTGKPILISNVSDHKYYFKDNVNAFVLGARKRIDIAELLKKLEQILLTSKNQLAIIGNEGKLIALKNFSLKEYSKKMVMIFNK